MMHIPPPSLLVHLGPGGYSVDCEEEELPRLDYLEQMLYVAANVMEYLLLLYDRVRV